MISGSSQGGIDISLMANYTGIGELGKETGIGNTITGEDRNTKDTTEWRPPLEKESTGKENTEEIEKESTEETEELLLSLEKEVTVDSREEGNMEAVKDVRVCFRETF